MNQKTTSRFSLLILTLLTFTQIQFTFASGIWGQVFESYDFGLPTPLPGATITAIPLDIDYDPAFTTVTNEEGAFELELDPWHYHITCTKEGYTFVETTIDLGEELEYLDFYLTPENDFPDTGWIVGQVTVQYSPMGPVMPVHGAYIMATPAWGWAPVWEAESDEMGMYELSLPVSEVPYLVYCNFEELENQMAEVELYEVGQESIVNFHFNAFDDAIPHPYDLHVEIQESEPPGAALYWEYDLSPGEEWTVFHIYANWDWSDMDWELIAETSETSHVFTIGEIVDWYTCFKVTAVVNGVESEPSNVACVSPEEPPLPAPYDLTAEFESNPLGGVVYLNWEYDNDAFVLPGFQIYASFGNDDSLWEHIGESEETHFEFELGDFNTEWLCFRVTSVTEGLESEPSNVACVEFTEPPWPPNPHDLTAYYDPTMGLGGAAVLNWEFSPPSEIPPIFYVYALNSNMEDEEWYFVGETEDTHFEHFFGDFVPPPDEACFKVTAVLEDGESEPSNIACVYTGDVEGDAVIFGEVFYVWGDAIEIVAGAHITAQGAVLDWSYETYTNEEGFYELGIIAGEFYVTCTLENGESQTTELLFIEPWHEERVDFWFGEYTEFHALTGMVFGNGPEEEFPLDDATIHATSLSSGEEFETHSTDGWYWMNLPYADEYHIVVSKEGYNPTDVTMFIEGVVEFSFLLESVDPVEADVLLIIGEGTGVPGGSVDIPLFIQNNSPVGGIQFTIQDEPNVATVTEFLSNNECFSASFNEVDGGVIGIYFSLEGCVLEPGEHHYGTLVYEIHDDADIEEGIELHFLEAIVASENGVPLSTEVISGFISLGLIGDINGDGEQNILDIVQLINFILFINEPTEFEFWAGDINADEYLNILDVVLLVNIILEG